MYMYSNMFMPANRTVSLSNKVVRLEERDRYKQLVAQFTNIQTPDSADHTWNRTAIDEPLQVQTDFLTKTKSHARCINMCVKS